MPAPSRSDRTTSAGRESLTIRVRTSGDLELLHDEDLGLEELGIVEIRRASHVEFDEDRQVWVVEDAATGERLYEAPRRSRCLAWERRHFNRALREGYRPFEGSG